MADLYSVITGLEPAQQDIVEAELLARQIVQAQFPDLDLREGTAARDLTIRPAAFLLALCKTAFDYYFSQNTLAGVTDDTPTEIVDGILGNLFLTRNEGTSAIINARLYFAIQKSVSIPSGTSFSTDGQLLFFPATSLSIPSTSMLYDSYEEEWYVDVDLTAGATGSGYNISTGSLLYFSNFDPYFLHAEINFLSATSIDSESNTQFIARASSAVSTRNLINIPSVQFALNANFNYLGRITTIGAGSEYMSRDQALIRGQVGATKLSTSAAFTSGTSRIRIVIPGNGYLLGQTLNASEQGGNIVIKYATIVNIVDADTFDIPVGFTVGYSVLNNFYITPVENDIYIHQGGCVDVYCGDDVYSQPEQYTLDSNGDAVVTGPAYKFTRINGSGDTVTTSAGYTITSNTYLTVPNVIVDQTTNPGQLTVTVPSHAIVFQRIVQLVGWPNQASSPYYSVTGVPDGNTVLLGAGLPMYEVEEGITPLVKYTNPYLDKGFSADQTVTVSFGFSYAGGLASFQVNRISYVTDVQNYLDLSTSRSLCGDYLARGFDVYELSFSLVVYGTLLPTTGAISAILEPYFASLQPGTELVLSNVVAQLSAGGITSLQSPIGCTFSFYGKDLFNIPDVPVTDRLQVGALSMYIVGNITVALESL